MASYPLHLQRSLMRWQRLIHRKSLIKSLLLATILTIDHVYAYTGIGHGGGDTNLYFYLPPGVFPTPLGPTSLTATAAVEQPDQPDLGGQREQRDRVQDRALHRREDCTGFSQIATVGANVTSYSNTGLTASTRRHYRVRAYNANGDSGYSNTASAVTQAAPALPAAPINLAATVISKSQINLSWTDNADNETGFRIQRCKGSTCTNFALIATVGANVTSYANTTLAANTTYRYRVYAYNASGNSDYSNVATATTRRR